MTDRENANLVTAVVPCHRPYARRVTIVDIAAPLGIAVHNHIIVGKNADSRRGCG